jgi:phosphotransferase system enzyme I (PtsI)
MTLSCSGIGVSRGFAIGTAHIIKRGLIEVSPRAIGAHEVSLEVERFEQAVSGARERLRSIQDQIPKSTRSDIIAFIDTHLLMLDDAALVEAPIDLIRGQHLGAEWALQIQRDALVRVFDEMDDPYLRTRKDDVDHVVNQIQKVLLQHEENTPSDLSGKVILAQDLTPADTILMRHQGIAAFVTEFGGPMSHTAILARSLGIPAIVGVHNASRCFRHGETLVIDGEQGTVLADVDQQILSHYHGKINQVLRHAAALNQLIGEPALTRDGCSIQLMANIELPEDIDATRELRADGVGLYRTEFLYMNRTEPPSEEEHYAAYRKVVEGLKGIPITIRTLDLGADKQLDSCSGSDTSACNPALGLRAIRLCLKEPKLFLPQLRAILRAAAHGPVRIMVPMLCNLQEVAKIKTLLEEARQSLARDGLEHGHDIPLGGMIEVPAAALHANAFARELDFLSIGTNDLVQYTLAIDRGDDEVNYLFDPLHPSVLRLIQMVIDAGIRHNIPVSMCGEMAGDPRFIPLLLGMGLVELSMQPGSLLEAKRILRNIDCESLRPNVKKLLGMIEQGETVDLLEQLSIATN